MHLVQKMFSAPHVLLALGLASVLSGCNDLSTPEGVLYSSWNSLKKEKVRSFKRTLRGEAREEYGNLAAMGRLYEEIRDLEFLVGEVALVRTESDFRGRDSLRVYEMEILARRADRPEVGTGTYMPFKTAEVECDIDYVVVGGTVGQCGWGDRSLPRCEQAPTIPPQFPPAERELARCWVSSLRPATF